jgi:hypothetical protein
MINELAPFCFYLGLAQRDQGRIQNNQIWLVNAPIDLLTFYTEK